MRYILALLALSACAAPEGRVETTSADLTEYRPVEVADPKSQTINGFSTGGFEYWPYKEAQPIYPDKVQWGFDAGSEAARTCMAIAHRDLVKILRDPPAELTKLRERHGVTSFYSWNNDMTGAAEGIEAGHQDIWLYQKRLIKWISQTERDGNCLVPDRADLTSFVKGCLAEPSSCGL